MKYSYQGWGFSSTTDSTSSMLNPPSLCEVAELNLPTSPSSDSLREDYSEILLSS